MPDALDALSRRWIAAKSREKAAIDERREIEDQISKLIKLDETEEGTKLLTQNNYKLKITSRMTRKVDGDVLQDIAAEHGLSDHLPTLFRCKPDINMSAWKKADENLTKPLLGAITTVPGRPSYSITLEGK